MFGGTYLSSIPMQLLNKLKSRLEHEEMHGKLPYVASKGIKSQIDGQSVVIGNYVLMQDEQVKLVLTAGLD